MMVSMAQLMEESGLAFGTSGTRGTVEAMTDYVCYAYTAAFLQYLESNDRLAPASEVAVGGDLRNSTARIMAAVAQAVTDRGYTLIHCGRLPSPALALFGMSRKIPSIMVTGSHIPDDRNGIKFNTAQGEILKDDEIAIKSQQLSLPHKLFDKKGIAREQFKLPAVDASASQAYKAICGFFSSRLPSRTAYRFI